MSLYAGASTWTPQYEEVIIPAGSVFSNGVITGYGLRFLDKKINEIDEGGRSAKFGEFEILSVVDYIENLPNTSINYKTIDGFRVTEGTVVNIMLLKDVKNLVPKGFIIFDGGKLTSLYSFFANFS